MDRLSSDQMLRRIHVRRVRGKPDAQPGLVLLGKLGQFRGQVDVEVVPDPDQRGDQLTVGGDDQVPVIRPAESLGLALAAAVDQQLIVKVPPGR
jgi:hypothetical protein